MARTAASEIAALNANVASLTATVTAWREEEQAARKQADETRKEMQDAITRVQDSAKEVSVRLDGMEAKLADAKSVTDQVKNWRAMIAGALLILGVIGGGLAFLKTYGAAIKAAFDNIINGG